MEKSKRKVWTEGETLLFLKCYKERKDEFMHVRKKKFAYENVLKDMIFQGFTDTTVNVAALVAKMRTLFNAYKTAKDNEKQTGTMPYMSEMDEIFGESCLVSNNHTINIGTNRQEALIESSEDTTVNAAALVAKLRTLLNAYKTAEDNEKQTGTIPYKSEMDDIFGESCLVSNNHTINIGTDSQAALIESSVNQCLKESTDFEEMLDDMQSTSRQSRSALNRSMCTPTEVYPQEPNAANATPYAHYQKSARERYFEQKIELKRKRAEERSKFYANIQTKIQDLVEKQDLQMEIEQKKLKIKEEKLKIEEEKLKLLQQFVMNKR
ncbi:uncharacterized protein LOC126754201 [Bactrocera neohumeralis]|uniref:uncharacterized protein LOC126754201 n=1 Tax=Bactrocera neohumeralis TaxID=98809 RepID=UPI0021669D20|nr:uncharacterized protein LOC126754201 [Bactrocera neohumeralis]